MSEFSTSQRVDRKGTVYDNSKFILNLIPLEHYDEMEDQLNQVDVSLSKEQQEDSKFEAAMRKSICYLYNRYRHG